MNDNAFYIRKQFADKKDRIDLLMSEDPEFLTMSQDYDACVDALRYWEQSQEPEAKARINEYRALIRELREEIGQVLLSFEARRLDRKRI